MKRKGYMAMKIRTARYIAKEGLANIFRNRLMSLASIAIVIASLLIFGIFFTVVFNMNAISKNIKKQPHIVAYCREDLADFEIENVKKFIENYEGVVEYEYVSRAESFENLKLELGESAEILDGLEPDFLRPSFILELEKPELSGQVAVDLEEVFGVEDVNYSQKSINLLTGIARWVNAASIFLITVLFIVSVFIIANTIKLTVYARRREINIMKYIGATDWFIRWPFVIEGMLIGVIGALVAFILTNYGYRSVIDGINAELEILGNEYFKMSPMNEMGMTLVLFYSVLGMVVGALGSFISMRRYLRV